MNLPSDKRAIRARLLLQRRTLSPEERRTKCEAIARRLLTSSEFRAAETVHSYLASKAEVQTQEIIEEALRLKKRVVVPIVEPKTNGLTLSVLTDSHLSQLQPGPFGILELRPEFRKAIDPKEVDLWLIPGVAFDEAGNRLGFGGGYYDRLLSGTSGRKIGLAFEFQIVHRLPIEPTDHPIDLIITETRTIDCKGEDGAGKAD